MSAIIDNYHNVQQDILETLSTAANCANWPNPHPSRGRRIPGLKLDHPRQLAVMHSLVRFLQYCRLWEVHHGGSLRSGLWLLA
jgi:hypothetical protein